MSAATLPAPVRHAAEKATLNFDWIVPQKPMLRIREIAAATGMGETFIEDEFKASEKFHAYNGGAGKRDSIRVPRLFVIELLVKSARYDAETKLDAALSILREFSGVELLRIAEAARDLAAKKGTR